MLNQEETKQAIRNMRNRTLQLDREGDYWSEDEKELLAKLFCEGVGISEMSLILQRTERAIAQQIEKMDLYGRQRYPQRRKTPRKDSGCLCDVCTAADDVCPRMQNCPSDKEDI